MTFSGARVVVIASVVVMTISLYAVLHDWRAWMTWVGLVLILVGTGFGGAALYQTHVRHGRGDLFPGLAKIARTVKRALSTRRPKIVEAQAHINLGALIATGQLTVEHQLEGPVEGQIAQLADRIRAVEARIAERHHKDVNAIRSDIDALRQASQRADEEIRTLTKDVAAGTVALQLTGLILVGAGSVLMAIPAITG